MSKNRVTFDNELILRDGKVGIGTSVPTSNLNVVGDVELRGPLKVTSTGSASTEHIAIKHYRNEGGTIAYELGNEHLFSVSKNSDQFLYVVSNNDGVPALSISTSSNASIANNLTVGAGATIGAGLTVRLSLGVGNSVGVGSYVQTPIVNFISSGAGKTTEISAKHYVNNNGSLVFQSPDRQLFSIDNSGDGINYAINDLEGRSALTVNDSGITTIRDLFQNRVNFTSIGSTAVENIQLNHYRNIAYQPAIGSTIDNRGAISFDSPSGISTDGVTFFPASLFALTNGGGNIFSVGGYQYFSGSNTLPVIDVTQSGKLGIGTTNPQSAFHVNTTAFFSGGIGVNTFTPATDVEIRGNLLVSGDGISTNRITLKPQTSGINTFVPSRGAVVYEGDYSITGDNSGGQLFTVLNDNSSLFTINNFVGLSSASFAPAGQKNITTVFQVLSNGRIGIATTNPAQVLQINSGTNVVTVDDMGELGIGTATPRTKLDVIGNASISGVTTVGLGSTSTPTVNSTMSFELTNNTTLTVRVRGTDGVVRTGIVTLA
jgi:hypothetical protein